MRFPPRAPGPLNGPCDFNVASTRNPITQMAMMNKAISITIYLSLTQAAIQPARLRVVRERCRGQGGRHGHRQDYHPPPLVERRRVVMGFRSVNRWGRVGGGPPARWPRSFAGAPRRSAWSACGGTHCGGRRARAGGAGRRPRRDSDRWAVVVADDARHYGRARAAVSKERGQPTNGEVDWRVLTAPAGPCAAIAALPGAAAAPGTRRPSPLGPTRSGRCSAARDCRG